MMEDAGWIAADQCCSEEAERDTHESDPNHDECVVCIFESSAMLSIKSDLVDPEFHVVALDSVSVWFSSVVPNRGLVGPPLSLFAAVTSFEQLGLQRVCPIRGPSLLS